MRRTGIGFRVEKNLGVASGLRGKEGLVQLAMEGGVVIQVWEPFLDSFRQLVIYLFLPGSQR